MESNRSIIISGRNSAKRFAIIVNDLEKYARAINVPTIKVFEDIIMDLRNLNNKDYDKKIKHFSFIGLDQKLIDSLVHYLIKAKSKYEQKEKQNEKNKVKQAKQDRWTKIEEQLDKSILDRKTNEIEKMLLSIKEDKTEYELSAKEKRSLLRRLEERKEKVKVREVAKETAKQAMKEIREIVDREFAEGNIKSEAMYLKSIECEVRNTNKINRETKEYLLEMINERKKDQIYYEQVEYFTNGFEFLSEYPELVNATLGNRARKFTDREAYDRFCNLRTQLQDGFSEYLQINKLLESKGINGTDKRILEARKSVMDKEIAKRREIEGR